MKTALMAAASALLLSAGAAAAAPAVTAAPVNLHAAPSAYSPVVGTVPAGVTVDVRGCIRGWCRVRFAGGRGFAPRRDLALAGRPAVIAAAPGYEPYDDYYDYGNAYGPSVGVFVGPGSRFHHRRWDGRMSQGHSWNGARTGTWQGGTGSPGTGAGTWQGRIGQTSAQPGTVPQGANRPPMGGRAAFSAPAGMPAGGAGVRAGGGAGVQAGGGAAIRGGAAFGGSLPR